MTSEWIETAAQASFDWGWQLVSEVRDRGEWESHALVAVFTAWSRSALDMNETEKAFMFVASNLDSTGTNGDAVRVIPKFLMKLQSEESINLLITHLSEFEELFDYVGTNCDDEFDVGLGDWLTIAINHPGGTVALFLVNQFQQLITHGMQVTSSTSEAGASTNVKHYSAKTIPIFSCWEHRSSWEPVLSTCS